jgi:hypothetical protein
MTHAKTPFDKLRVVSTVEPQRTPREENKKLEARNPKYETNPNNKIPNVQNYRVV